MRIAIVGAGTIGCLFGVRLHRSGHKVLLIHHKRQTIDALRRTGVKIRETSGKLLRARLEVKQSISRDDRPDLVLLTVKAYDTEAVARHLERNLHGTPQILSLQNGLGNIETLCHYFPKNRILGGTTTEAARQTHPGMIIHTGEGITWIGDVQGKRTQQSRHISRLLQRAGFKAEATANISGVIWSKAIVNSAINPITALTGVPNGKLIEIASLRDAASRLVSEGARVAEALGVSPTPSSAALLFRVLNSSRNNESSMLRDIRAGKKTEIRELNGWIAKIGERVGVSTPHNSLLNRLVLGVEASYGVS